MLGCRTSRRRVRPIGSRKFRYFSLPAFAKNISVKYRMTTSGVYTITAPSGSKYVGMSLVSVEARWKSHRKDLKRGVHKCKGLQRAFLKYGIENLSFEIVEELDGESKETLLKKEQFWWDEFQKLGCKLYNGRPSGNGSVLHTAETRSRISKSLEKDDALHRRENICLHCGSQFSSKRRIAKFCSRQCAANNLSRFSPSDAVALYVSGLSLRQVAKQFNVSHIAIRDSLLRQGQKLRKSR